MKKQTLNIRTLAFALIALVTVAFATPALANNEKDEKPVQLTFIGNLNNQPVYKLDLNNLNEAEYSIVIKDAAGEVLYTEKVKGTNISRKFQLNTSEVEENDLRFEVVNRKSNAVSIYAISKSISTVQDLSINKIK